ncbi:MAG: NPXTG-anchored protein [Clostridia bacterium]|nr:NPXTG-anchored protein [Clostridia bacterium]MBR4049344.1 NPXTG-anchored protein [Clostridia bacterium]
MKKICAVLLALAFVFATASVALAAVSPVAPTIEHIETTTKAPTTVAPTTQVKPTDKPTTAPTTQKVDVDETTTKVADTTTKPVESDTNPSSPDTGVAQTLGKASAAAAVVLVLSAAGVYTSKKKVTE